MKTGGGCKGKCSRRGLRSCPTHKGVRISCRVQANAGVCAACPHGGVGRKRCTAAGGLELVKHVNAGICPLNKFPDQHGVAVRRFLWWRARYVVQPWPERVALAAKLDKPWLAEDLPGCGCLVAVKEEWPVRIRWWWRGVTRGFWSAVGLTQK